jgi:hypothetical protein
MAGNKATKYEIELETEDYWYSPIYREENGPNDEARLLHYIRINKHDYEEKKLTPPEFWAERKVLKKK